MAARSRNPIDTTTYSGRFAARLKELREKAKLTPEQVAEKIGVTPTAIYHWESGRMVPALEKFPKISAAYKLKKTKDLMPNE